MASTTAASRTAARKRAATRPAVLGAAADFEPIRIVADKDVPEDRVPLFYIGDDEYTVPRSVPAGIALQYMRVARESGTEAGAGALLSRALGEEAYLALEKARGLTDEQLNRIIQIVLDLSLGKVEKGGKAKA